MKLIKILALVLSIALLSCAFIACDSGDAATDTTAAETEAATKVEVKLIIKDGSTTKYEGTVTCNGTLGNAIEVFCAGEFEEEFEVFDANGLLTTIGWWIPRSPALERDCLRSVRQRMPRAECLQRRSLPRRAGR